MSSSKNFLKFSKSKNFQRPKKFQKISMYKLIWKNPKVKKNFDIKRIWGGHLNPSLSPPPSPPNPPQLIDPSLIYNNTTMIKSKKKFKKFQKIF